MKFNGGKKLEKRESIHKLASFVARSEAAHDNRKLLDR